MSGSWPVVHGTQPFCRPIDQKARRPFFLIRAPFADCRAVGLAKAGSFAVARLTQS
jgi:hypothetical protein